MKEEEEDDDDGYYGDETDGVDIGVEERTRRYEDWDAKWEECKQRNLDVLPDQYETQLRNLQDILWKMPEDVALILRSSGKSLSKGEWLKL